jgi:enterochelin esterase-like enzyme
MLVRRAETLPGDDHPLESRCLQRRKTARIIVPPGPPPPDGWPVCILLHGFSGHRASWLQHWSAFPAAQRARALWVFPESGRRWFINDAAGHHYEDYLVTELVPFVERKFPTRPASWMIGGFSMGGAAAVQIAVRHARRFGATFAVAGAFYAAERTGDPYAAVRHGSCLMPTEAEHDRVWGPPGSEVRQRYHSDRIAEQAAGTDVRIVLEVGTGDYARVLEQNRRFHRALLGRGIAHRYSEHEGDHGWAYAAAGAARCLASLAGAS